MNSTAVLAFVMSLTQAEQMATRTSNQLKAFVSDQQAAVEQADAQYSALIPRLTFDASYRYQLVVPNIEFQNLTLPLGATSNYSFGPTLNYTLWDTFSSRKSYYSLNKLADSRDESRRNAELQLLLQTRYAYIRVQETLDELSLVQQTLELSRAQNRDIETRFRAGAASRLDKIESGRGVLSYQLAFQQKQAELSSDLKDLIAITSAPIPSDLSHPGPAGMETVTLPLKVDGLEKSIADDNHLDVFPPDETQPSIASQELIAQSNELSAESTKALLYPTIGLQARTSLDYPNGPILEQIHQSIFTVNLSLPLFETDRTRHLSSERLREADAARFQKDQLTIDLNRDFKKAQELLQSYREQRKLAFENVKAAQEAAHLYYDQYKAGKVNLIDVQSANVRALTASVDAARIDAQILNEIAAMRAISGKEQRHE